MDPTNVKLQPLKKDLAQLSYVRLLQSDTHGVQWTL